MNHQLDIFQAHRIGPVYHNTTAKTGEDLEKAQVKASGQTEAILKLFQDHPTHLIHPLADLLPFRPADDDNKHPAGDHYPDRWRVFGEDHRAAQVRPSE